MQAAGSQPSTWVTESKFPLVFRIELSVLNFRICLLMYPGSLSRPSPSPAASRKLASAARYHPDSAPHTAAHGCLPTGRKTRPTLAASQPRRAWVRSSRTAALSGAERVQRRQNPGPCGGGSAACSCSVGIGRARLGEEEMSSKLSYMLKPPTVRLTVIFTDFYVNVHTFTVVLGNWHHLNRKKRLLFIQIGIWSAQHTWTERNCLSCCGIIESKICLHPSINTRYVPWRSPAGFGVGDHSFTRDLKGWVHLAKKTARSVP